MVGRIVLVLVQVAGAWFLGRYLAQFIPLEGVLRLGVYAALFSVIVWLLGLVGAEILKAVEKPSGGTLTWTIAASVLAIGATFVPGIVLPFDAVYLPLLGAVAGYQLTR